MATELANQVFSNKTKSRIWEMEIQLLSYLHPPTYFLKMHNVHCIDCMLYGQRQPSSGLPSYLEDIGILHLWVLERKSTKSGSELTSAWKISWQTRWGVVRSATTTTSRQPSLSCFDQMVHTCRTLQVTTYIWTIFNALYNISLIDKGTNIQWFPEKQLLICPQSHAFKYEHFLC